MKSLSTLQTIMTILVVVAMVMFVVLLPYIFPSQRGKPVALVRAKAEANWQRTRGERLSVLRKEWSEAISQPGAQIDEMGYVLDTSKRVWWKIDEENATKEMHGSLEYNEKTKRWEQPDACASPSHSEEKAK